MSNSKPSGRPVSSQPRSRVPSKTVQPSAPAFVAKHAQLMVFRERAAPSQKMRGQAFQAVASAKPDFAQDELTVAVNAVCAAVSAGIPSKVCSDVLSKSSSAAGFVNRLSLLVDAQNPDAPNDDIWRIATQTQSAGALSALLKKTSGQTFRHALFAFAEKKVSEMNARELEDLVDALDPNAEGLEGKTENVPTAIARLFGKSGEQRGNVAEELSTALDKAKVNVTEIRGRVETEFALLSVASSNAEQKK